jgi:hypothetical protein
LLDARDTGVICERTDNRTKSDRPITAADFAICPDCGGSEVDRNGRISRCGDEMMRVMLYEAAQSMLRSKKWSWLKAWAMQIARRRGMKRAIVALARRLAVITAQASSDDSRASLAASKCSLIRNACQSYFDPGFNLSKSLCSGTFAKAAIAAP